MAMPKQTRTAKILAAVFFASLSLTALILTVLMATYLPPQDPNAVDITVPSLTGTMYDEGQAAEGGSLSPSLFSLTVEFRTDDAPAGTVLSQSPTPGARRRIIPGKKPCSLHLIVSAGQQILELPDYVGSDARDATLQLKQQGIRVVLQKATTSRYSPGQVIATEPAAGTILHPGDTVTLTESKAPTVRTLTVPDLSGMTEQQAKDRLRSAGFKAGSAIFEDGYAPAGTVVSQYPLSNTLVTAGTAVNLTLSNGALLPPQEQLPKEAIPEEQSPAESPEDAMPSPDGGNTPPQSIPRTHASPTEDEIAPQTEQKDKKFNWFGWLS